MFKDRFVETLRMEDGVLRYTQWHEERMAKTLEEAFGCCPFAFRFSEVPIPDAARTGVFKCRVEYGRTIEKIEFAPYTPKQITSLKLVTASDDLDYHLKYADRSLLNALREKRGTCSDILIVHRGELTDTSYSNIVFDDGQRLVTPAATLLNGTCRQRLLREGRITEEHLTPDDLRRFSRAILINAMIGLRENIALPVSEIH